MRFVPHFFQRENLYLLQTLKDCIGETSPKNGFLWNVNGFLWNKNGEK